MTRNELKNNAKWAIIDKLEEGYEGYLCDLHHEVFNTEMYTNDEDEAAEILDSLGSYCVIGEIVKYEQDNFGYTSADKYSDPLLGVVYVLVYYRRRSFAGAWRKYGRI